MHVKKSNTNKLKFKAMLAICTTWHGAISLGLGSGLPKFAPGTFGTIFGIIVFLLFRDIFAYQIFMTNRIWGGVLIITLFFLSLIPVSKTAKSFNNTDSEHIVIDEIIAIWLVLVFLPKLDIFFIALAFITFRFFDIVKPFPIRQVERFLDAKHVSFGIMFDDFLAALYSLAVIWVLYIFLI